MGEANKKKKQKEQFKRAHPHCCFCGGERPTEEWDHVPNRAMFTARQWWPEGYVFPACAECNDKTTRTEMIMAALISLADRSEGRQKEDNWKKKYEDLKRRYPNDVPKVMSPLRKQKALAQRGIEFPYSLANFPLMETPNMPAHGCDYLIKLFCAIYYKEVGKIFPKNGVIILNPLTNTDTLSERTQKAFNYFNEALGFMSECKRNNRDLSDQFQYRWSQDKENRLLGIAGHIRETFFFFAIGFTMQEDFEKLPSDFSRKFYYAKIDGVFHDVKDDDGV